MMSLVLPETLISNYNVCTCHVADYHCLQVRIRRYGDVYAYTGKHVAEFRCSDGRIAHTERAYVSGVDKQVGNLQTLVVVDAARGFVYGVGHFERKFAHHAVV